MERVGDREKVMEREREEGREGVCVCMRECMRECVREGE